jgi:hypothetical protein
MNKITFLRGCAGKYDQPLSEILNKIATCKDKWKDRYKFEKLIGEMKDKDYPREVTNMYWTIYKAIENADYMVCTLDDVLMEYLEEQEIETRKD